MNLKTIKQVNLTGKRVLLLVDYDVPTQKVGSVQTITDDTRIKQTLPTINYLRDNQAKIIILTKRGRPDGQVIPNLRVDIVASRLEKYLREPVKKLDFTIGPQVTDQVRNMKPQDVLMLENSRFLPGEANNDAQTAKELSLLADLVVNDAFSLSHRAQASNCAIARYLPMVAGLNLLIEVKMLSQLTNHVQRPFVAIIGGAKISDKLPAIENLGKIADVVLVGGGVANNFLKASGVDVAKSYLEDVAVDQNKRHINYVKLAGDLLNQAKPGKIQYPLDVMAATSPNQHSPLCTINFVNPTASDCQDNIMFLDIGPITIKLYQEIIRHAKTIFWNGPMGVFENPSFATGTQAIAQAIAANTHSTSILGGGDTIAAINQFSQAKKYDYVSASGGASLEFLSGSPLPGLQPMVIS